MDGGGGRGPRLVSVGGVDEGVEVGWRAKGKQLATITQAPSIVATEIVAGSLGASDFKGAFELALADDLF